MNARFKYTLGFLILFFICVSSSQSIGGWFGKTSSGDEEILTVVKELKEAEPAGREEIRARLEMLVRQYPSSEQADNGLLEISRSLLADEIYERSIGYLQEIVQNYSGSDSVSEARFLLGVAYYKLKNFETAIEIFKGIDNKDIHFDDASVLQADANIRLGKIGDAVEIYARLVKSSPDKAAKIEASLLEYIPRINDAGLEAIFDKTPESKFGAAAALALAKRAFAAGDYALSKKIVEKLTKKQPDSPQAVEAKTLFEDIEAAGTADVHAIGLLLPLSGKWGAYGRMYFEGASLAVGAFQPTTALNDPFRLEVADTESDPAVAAAAAQELAVKRRVIAIAGPLQKETAVSAAKVAQRFGVPIITMTMAEQITEIGPMVFRNSIAPRDQVRSIIYYATTARGLKNFAILYPDNTIGKLYNEAFATEVKRYNGTVVLSLPYKPGQSDFKMEINEISKVKRNIDALFIPDTYLAAATIAPQLPFYNVVRLKLLGSSGWNDPRLVSLLTGQTSSIEGAMFPDAFYADSTSPIVRTFIDDFEVAFGRKPGLFEALGYETVKVLIDRVRLDNVKTRKQMADALAKLNNFQTFAGTLSAQPDRSFNHPMFMLEVKNSEIREIAGR